jgi:hypothetical protein
MKFTYPGVPEPSYFAKLFMRKRVSRPPRRHRGDAPLEDMADAKHALLHSPDGRALLRDTPNASIDALAAHLLEASRRAPTNKREATEMDPTTKILKSARQLGEHGMTALIQKYADSNRLPNETSAQAFTRIFTDESNTGQALRHVYAIAKGQAVAPIDEPADDDERDDADDVEVALRRIESLADQLRARFPSLTKAQAFSKIYTDPANVALAKRERRASMRRIGAV